MSLNKPVNIDLNVVLKEATLRIVELKQTLNPTSQNSKKKNIIDFSKLKINLIKLRYLSYADSSWLADFKMKAMYLIDTRPDSNLAVKEYELFFI